MREIRVLICDDEPLARRGIRQMLTRHTDATVIGEARDGREALIAIETLAPDLIFLDVQMPGLGGFDVVRARGPDQMPAVIFVTAYDEFAVRAFDVNALDYLVKPLVATRFDAAMDRLRRHLWTSDALGLSQQLARLLASDAARAPHAATTPAIAGSEQAIAGATPAIAGAAPAMTGTDRIAVSSGSGLLMLDVRDIDWIGAENYYAVIHTGGRRHLVREALSSLQARLDPDRFVRVHRSALVNIDRIRELRSEPHGGSAVVLRDGRHLPLSRRRRDAVAARLRLG